MTVLVIAGLVAGTANAGASSITTHFIGNATMNNGAVIGQCTRAEMVDTNINRASTLSFNPGSCGTSKSVPGGYLSVQAMGYRDGAYCGSTAEFYSSGTSVGWVVSSTICANPAGSQTFRTRSWSGFYHSGATMAYYGIDSLNQTY